MQLGYAILAGGDWDDYGCIFWTILYGFVCAAAACCLVRLAWYSISWTWVAVFLTFSIGKVIVLPKRIPRNTDIHNSSCRRFSPLPDPRHHPTPWPVLRAERLGCDTLRIPTCLFNSEVEASHTNCAGCIVVPPDAVPCSVHFVDSDLQFLNEAYVYQTQRSPRFTAAGRTSSDEPVKRMLKESGGSDQEVSLGKSGQFDPRGQELPGAESKKVDEQTENAP
ncbi:hypothetical protein BKA83DRAFT_4130258 [Pisolithus microcarpus]|nr:hypothetical protein BKA83DRAFT_4130258 [Pisolithus microcarpus]